LRESRLLGHSYIGTEHILLGLLSEGEGEAARVLTGLGADPNEVRQQVTRILDEYRRERGPQSG
jgi:ATP-dependent Clp protease ATP-binding subunit ClpC